MERRLTAILAADVVGYSRLKRAEEALRRFPESSRPAQLGAAAMVSLGQTERAEEWMERALSIDPEDTHIKYNAAFP